MITLVPVTADVLSAALGPGVAASGLACCPDWPHEGTLHAFRSWVGTDPVPGVLALHDGLVVGEGGWVGPPDPDGTVEIGFGLAPSYRGRGLGRALLDGLCQWSADRGAVGLRAEVRPDNAASLRLLHAAGFADLGVRAGHHVLVRRAT